MSDHISSMVAVIIFALLGNLLVFGVGLVFDWSDQTHLGAACVVFPVMFCVGATSISRNERTGINKEQKKMRNILTKKSEE